MTKRERTLASESHHRASTLDDVDFLTCVSDPTHHGALRFRADASSPFLDFDQVVPKIIPLPALIHAAGAVARDGGPEFAAVKTLLDARSDSLGGARPKAAPNANAGAATATTTTTAQTKPTDLPSLQERADRASPRCAKNSIALLMCWSNGVMPRLTMASAGQRQTASQVRSSTRSQYSELAEQAIGGAPAVSNGLVSACIGTQNGRPDSFAAPS